MFLKVSFNVLENVIEIIHTSMSLDTNTRDISMLFMIHNYFCFVSQHSNEIWQALFMELHTLITQVD